MTIRERIAPGTVLAFALLLVAYAVVVIFLSGCAAAQREDGSTVVGFPINGDGGSVSGLGAAAGGIANLIAPGTGTVIGGAVAALAAAFGWGAHQRRKGERDGWDEAAGTPAQPAQARAADPVPVVPVVPVSVAKEAA